MRDKSELSLFAYPHSSDGGLYELDGRKPFPIRHGASSDETFLHDAAAVCSQFMARDPNELHFSMLALAKSL